MTDEIVAVDIGGTHARFAVATISRNKYVNLGEIVTLETADCVSFEAVWQEFSRLQGGRLPRKAAIAAAGGMGFRIKDRLIHSGFAERFVAKGRFESFMKAIPVKLITHPQAGLFGAAAAFAKEFG